MRLGEALCLTHADWHPGLGGTPFIQVAPRDLPRGVRVKGGRGRRIYVSDELERLYGDDLWTWLSGPGRTGSRSATSGSASSTSTGEATVCPDAARARLPDQRPAGREAARLAAGMVAARLRHTHASALLLAGVPLHVVSRRLGHADVQTTMDLYGWVTEDAELRAVAGWRSFTEGWRVTGA